MRCMARQSNCDNCLHYIYNEICDWYECEVDLDEDEMGRFMQEPFGIARISVWMMNMGWCGSKIDFHDLRWGNANASNGNGGEKGAFVT